MARYFICDQMVPFLVIRDLLKSQEDVKTLTENITTKTLVVWGEHDKVSTQRLCTCII